MTKVTKKIDKYIRLNGDLEVIQYKCFMLGTGEVLIFEDDLVKLYNVSKRMLQIYKEKNGLEHHPTSVKGAVVYDLIYATKWYSDALGKSIKTQQTTPVKTDSAEGFNLKLVKVDYEIKEQKLSTDKLKHQALTKELVKAEDLDRAMAEQAVLHKTFYMDDLDLLPTLLQGLTIGEIKKTLEDHYETRIENASSFINKTFKDVGYLYKKIMEILK